MGEAEITQGIRNIVHNISDNFLDLSIPKSFASPSLLIDALHGFRNLAERQLEESLKINSELGDTWLNAVSYSVTMNTEVKEAIDYALSLSEDAHAAFIPLQRLNRILDSIPDVAHELTIRRKDNCVPRPTIKINDEYDLQDLFRALLKIDFMDIRPEEWCPSYAGSSNRMDFLLKREKIVVELKKTRPSHNRKNIGEELIIDIANYLNHPDCEHLVCYVWDKEKRIANPQGLIADLEKSNIGFVSIQIYQ